MLERSETELINDVISRVGFNQPERARVHEWARQALTVVVLAAERAGSSGTRLSDNVLFHEIALRWSPAYGEALQRGPGIAPSEMRRETLEAARDDIKASGLRLQELFAKATQGVAGRYKTRMTAKGRRAILRGTPLRGEALKEARALLGLPPLEQAHVKKLQELLGHASLTMTMRYAHLAPEHLRTAVSRLDGLVGSQPASVSAQASAQEPVETVGASQKSLK